MDRERVSKLLSYVLRHNPSAIGIELDSRGWADADRVIEGISGKYPLDRAGLEEIVREDKKGRYSFNEDGTKIRANQGHSVNVNPDLKAGIPPEVLYHGTAEKYAESIIARGLLRGSRRYVHLSRDIATALSVGSRHGKPVVFEVDAKRMADDGHVFYISENGVWLTENVPNRYLKLLKTQ